MPTKFIYFNCLLQINKERAGILIGAVVAGPTVYSEAVQTLIERGPKKISPFFVPYSIANMAPAKLGIDVGFMGPNYSISTACASSNYCLHAAANHIRQGEVDLMLAGGTEAGVVPVVLGGFGVCGVLSQRNDDPKTASRPWDKDRDGFVLGEGAAVLVYKYIYMLQTLNKHVIKKCFTASIKTVTFLLLIDHPHEIIIAQRRRKNVGHHRGNNRSHVNLCCA